MTPFRDAEGRRALNDIWEFCPGGPLNGAVKGMLVPYFDRTFDTVTEPEQFTEDGVPYDAATDGVDTEIGYDIWVCAAMLDAVLCGTDYTADCTGFTEMYGNVRDVLRRTLTETKLFSKKPKYDVPGLCAKAAAALPYISGECCDSEAAESMGERRGAFIAAVQGLAERLSACGAGQISTD